MTRIWLESIFEWPGVRWLAALAFMTRGYLLKLCGCRYRAIGDFCWVVRVSQVEPWRRVARNAINQLIDVTRHTGRNPLVDSYLRSSLSRRCASLYSIAGSGQHDLFRDLIVLKTATPNEKGVILLKYARTFEAVVALFDFHRLIERYTFVLEPCWAGYCDPALLMYLAPRHPVIVQCFTAEDYAFIESIGLPLIPVSLGPADWVNTDTFTNTSAQPQIYDLVMVANWGAHKRHAQLFRALSTIHDRDIRVLLVGFPWAGRTSADILREAREITSNRIQIELVEQVPHTELARYLSQSKVFVFLSKKEGDNKALVEAMFADVPAVVFARTVGGARNRVNPATGIFSTDAELADNIRYMLDHHGEFSPRSWALKHTGSKVATRIIDAALRRGARNSSSSYSGGIVEKTNAPNLAYLDPTWRNRFQVDYDFVTSCVRQRRVR